MCIVCYPRSLSTMEKLPFRKLLLWRIHTRRTHLALAVTRCDWWSYFISTRDGENVIGKRRLTLMNHLLQSAGDHEKTVLFRQSNMISVAKVSKMEHGSCWLWFDFVPQWSIKKAFWILKKASTRAATHFRKTSKKGKIVIKIFVIRTIKISSHFKVT